MQKKNLLKSGMMLGLALALSGQAMGATHKKAAEESSSASSIETGMMGKWGVGFDTIPGASTGGGVLPGLAQPNALDLRYWNSDRIALEGMLAFNMGSQPGGTDSAGKPVNNGTANFGLGAGVNYVWKKPYENVLIKMIGKVSYASAGSTNIVAGTSVGSATSTIALSGHLGFEAFIPAWPALSVEGSVGLGLTSQSGTSTTPGSTATSTTSFGIDGAGFSPISVAAHFYF